MSEFDNRIDGIRRTFADKKAEAYAFCNSDTAGMEEYIKNLYLKLLCTVLQYDNTASEMQVQFLKRLVKGMGAEEKAEDYMRRALEIEEKDFDDFFEALRDNKIKYYFALEGLILVSLSEEGKQSYDYLSELLEILKIDENDLSCISLVAKSVLTQKSEPFSEAMQSQGEHFADVNFLPYVKNYYRGLITSTKKLIQYSAPEKAELGDIELRTNYTKDTVMIENLIIKLSKSIHFKSCKQVVLRNCDFVGGKSSSLIFYGCEKLTIEDCSFKQFDAPVLWEDGNNQEVYITNCDFEDITWKYDRRDRNSSDGWKPLGMVIHTENKGSDSKYIIRKSSFRNCTGINTCKDTYYKYEVLNASAIVSNCCSEVEECSFQNCWNYNCCKELDRTGGEGLHLDTESKRRTLFLPNTKGSNNKVIGSANFC